MHNLTFKPEFHFEIFNPIFISRLIARKKNETKNKANQGFKLFKYVQNIGNRVERFQKTYKNQSYIKHL